MDFNVAPGRPQDRQWTLPRARDSINPSNSQIARRCLPSRPVTSGAPLRLPDGPKMTKRAPRVTQKGPKAAPWTPRAPKESSKRGPGGDLSFPAPKGQQKSPQGKLQRDSDISPNWQFGGLLELTPASDGRVSALTPPLDAHPLLCSQQLA